MMNKNESNLKSGVEIPQSEIRSPQSNPLRILLLEDSQTDAELNEHLLRKAGIDFTSLRVETSAAFVAALDTFRPDIILADYNLPEFDGLAALQIVRRDHPEVPVIMVTGALSDIEAVELIHAGAKDYMLKDRPARLAAAVQRALSIEQGIRARKAAEYTLRESEEKFRAIFENAKDGIVLTDAESGLVTNCNPEFERQCGRPLAQLKTLHPWDLRPPELQEAAHRKFEEIKTAGHGSTGLGFLRPDSTYMPAEVVATRVRIGVRDYLISISRDITERKQIEAKLHESEERYYQLFENMNSCVAIYQPDNACEVFTIKSVNRAVERVEQVKREEVLGRSVEDCFPGVRAFGLMEVFQRVCRSGKAEHFPPAFYQDQRISGWRDNYVYLLDSGELVVVYDDVTERKQAEVQIAEQLNELRRWYDATLGQGMRNIELKREVNELLKQAGQPPRYPKAE